MPFATELRDDGISQRDEHPETYESVIMLKERKVNNS